MRTPDCLLTIAGTDPSGGAGIQVDLQVFRDYGYHGLSVVTAVVCQNTIGVRGFEPGPAVDVHDQLDAVFDDVSVAGIKIGMLASPDIAEMLGAYLRGRRIGGPVVYDPVLASGGGSSTLHRTGMVETVVESVLPEVDWLTPNVPEAESLLDVEIVEEDEMLSAGRELAEICSGDVLLKAGHFSGGGETIRDVWAHGEGEAWLSPLERVEEDVRGTGCQLSSALAAELAGGKAGREAAEGARAYLNRLLHRSARHIGKGRPVIVRGGDAS